MTTVLSATAACPIPLHVCVRGDAGTLIACSYKPATIAPLGLSTSAATTGATVVVQADGVVQDDSWAWTPFAKLYAADDGTLTQDSSLATQWTSPVGVAISRNEASLMFIQGATGGTGGGTTITSGTDTLDFGAAPGGNAASTAITGQAGIVSGSKCRAWLEYVTGSDHNAEEHALVPMTLTCGTIVAGTGFTVFGRSEWRLTGKWNFRWEWY